jgi:DNA-binding transcriptional MerR regulator
MEAREYSASEVRKLLQFLFPHRRLVLSQFTFFNQTGVAQPSGESFRRGRRCYRLQDLLSIACVLALKEEGIPLKNIESVPSLIRENLNKIFLFTDECFLSGYGNTVDMKFGDMKLGSGGEANSSEALLEFLDSGENLALFWGFDVTLMARQLLDAAQRYEDGLDSVKTGVANAA